VVATVFSKVHAGFQSLERIARILPRLGRRHSFCAAKPEKHFVLFVPFVVKFGLK